MPLVIIIERLRVYLCIASKHYHYHPSEMNQLRSNLGNQAHLGDKFWDAVRTQHDMIFWFLVPFKVQTESIAEGTPYAVDICQ